MGALASPSTWRQAPYSYKGYLWLDNPPVVYSARVNQTSFVYPVYEVAYDGGSGTLGNVKPGMLVLFGSSAGASDKGRTFVRKNPTSNMLYFGRSSRGIREGRVDLADNLYITILDTYLPHIAHEYTDATGTVFKSQDLDFATYGDVGQSPPKANAGIYYAAFVDADDEITVDFDGSASFATEPGATIASYVWTFPGGTPSSSSSMSPSNVVFGPGRRWVSLTVTDTNGKTHTARALVVGLEKTGANAPLTCEADGSQTLGFDEHRMAFRVIQSIPKTSYPEGTVAIYIEHERFGASSGSIAGPADRQHVKFVGYLGSINTKLEGTEKGLIKRTVISCYDVLSKIKELSTRGGDLIHASVPTRWGEMNTPTIDRALWYLLYWHSTVPGIADFTNTGTGTSYSFPDESYPESSLLSQMQHFAQLIRHMVTCDDKGRIQVKPDPLLHDPSGGSTTVARTTVSTVSIVEGDIESIDVTEDQPPGMYGLMEKARVAGVSAAPLLYSQAPGDALGSGESNETGGSDYLVVSQEELDAQVGHKYERANAVEGLYRIVLKKVGDVGIVPGNMEWIQVTLSAQYAAERGLTFTAARFLVHTRTITHRHADGSKDMELMAEREITGTPGVPQYFPEAGETPPNAPDEPSFDEPGITPEVPTRDPYPGAPTGTPPIADLPPENPDDELPTYPFPPGPGGGGGGGYQPALPVNGNTVARWANTFIKLTTTFLSVTPIWRDITPTEHLTEQYEIAHFMWSGFGKDGYALLVDIDAEMTKVLYCEDLSLSSVNWVEQSELEGGYGYAETTAQRGKVYIFTTNADFWQHTFDFTIESSDDPSVTPGDTWAVADGGTRGGVYSSGNGYQQSTPSASGLTNSRQVHVEKSFDPATITRIEAVFDYTLGSPMNSTTFTTIINDGLTGNVLQGQNDTTGTNRTVIFTGNTTIDLIGVRIRSSNGGGSPPSVPGAVTLKRVIISGVGVNPFADPTQLAGSLYSTDYGETWGSLREVDDLPIDGLAVDSIPRTQDVLVMAYPTAYKASAGGTYSAYGTAIEGDFEPGDIFVPRVRFGKDYGDEDFDNTGGNPEFLVGSITEADANDAALWKVTSSGNTHTDITPDDGSNKGVSTFPHVLAMPWNSGKVIAGLLKFGPLWKLVTSEDAGDNWDFRRTAEGTPGYLSMIKANQRALYWLEAGVPYYSPDLGATVYKKATGDSSTGLAPYG